MSRVSLKKKLLALCAALTATTSAVGGLSYLITRDITANYRYVVDVTLNKGEALKAMEGAFKEVRIALRTIGIEGINATDRQRAVEDAKKWIAAYEEAEKVYQGLPYAPGEEAVFKPLQASWEAFKGVGARILTLAAAEPAQSQAALREIFLKDCPEAAATFGAAMESLTMFQDIQAQSHVDEATTTADRGNFTMALFSILAPLCGLFFGIVFSNRLARLLKRLADNLASGADQVNGASEKISAAGEAISASSTEQAAALQETVASLDEVSAMVNRNAENAKRSGEVSLQGRDAALRGKASMNDMRLAIEEINESNAAIKNQIDVSNQEIANIVTIIGEISTKTKIINDIVFQTKLLSFNASVEAARAGEHGKGFAVVAEEVGNLAQMSGNASREISQLLEASIQKVQTTVQETKARVESLMIAGHEKVQAGSVIAERCGVALDEIVKNVEGLTHMVTEIATASSEQAQGVKQINEAMGHLDKVAQQNVATAQQTAGAALQLNDQAVALQDVITELVRTVDGAAEDVASVVKMPIRSVARKESVRVASAPKRAA